MSKQYTLSEAQIAQLLRSSMELVIEDKRGRGAIEGIIKSAVGILPHLAAEHARATYEQVAATIAPMYAEEVDDATRQAHLVELAEKVGVPGNLKLAAYLARLEWDIDLLTNELEERPYRKQG